MYLHRIIHGNDWNFFSMFYGNDFEKSKREMTQDILQVLYGNEPILLKVLTDFDSILCERVMAK